MRGLILFSILALALLVVEPRLSPQSIRRPEVIMNYGQGCSQEQAEAAIKVLLKEHLVSPENPVRAELKPDSEGYSLVLAGRMYPQIRDRYERAAQLLSEQFLDKKPVRVVFENRFFIQTESVEFVRPLFISDHASNFIRFGRVVGRGPAEQVYQALRQAGYLNDQQSHEVHIDTIGKLLAVDYLWVDESQPEKNPSYRAMGALILKVLHWEGPARLTLYRPNGYSCQELRFNSP
ncbi:MAG: hypothetical protein U0931_15580 [Vulcanimicrobiota bacterium]